MTDRVTQVHVVPKGEDWGFEVVYEGEDEARQTFSGYETKTEAINAARDFCRAHTVEGHSLELHIHNLDGEIAGKDSFGVDPPEIEG